MSKGVSIIICCYNSVPRIEPTLRHLAVQEVPDNIPWEVILVDNNSNDGTALYAQQIWHELNVPTSFKVVSEKKAGLNYARLKGIETSIYEYLLFCDDDNWLSNNYIQLGYHILKQNNQIGALGGLGYGVSTINFPKWFGSVKAYYAIGKQYENGIIPLTKSLYGAGLFVKKKCLNKLFSLGFSFLSTDRKGKNLSSGGDYELCMSIKLIGYELWSNEQLTFQHFIAPERLTRQHFKKLRKGIASSSINVIPYVHEISDKPNHLIWYIVRFLKNISINVIKVVILLFKNTDKSIFVAHQILSEIKSPLKVYFLRQKIKEWKFK